MFEGDSGRARRRLELLRALFAHRERRLSRPVGTRLWSYALSARARLRPTSRARVNLYGGPEETHLAYLGVPRRRTWTARSRATRTPTGAFNPLTYPGERDHFFEPHYELIHTLVASARARCSRRRCSISTAAATTTSSVWRRPRRLSARRHGARRTPRWRRATTTFKTRPARLVADGAGKYHGHQDRRGAPPSDRRTGTTAGCRVCASSTTAARSRWAARFALTTDTTPAKC